MLLKPGNGLQPEDKHMATLSFVRLFVRWRYAIFVLTALIYSCLVILTISAHQQQGMAKETAGVTTNFITANVGPYPNRIRALHPQDKFSFVHISKCAGATWINLFKKVLKLNICPELETGVENSVYYNNKYECKDATYTLTSMRSPRHHVWSQFAMCKYSSWGQNMTKDEDFPRSGDEDKDDEVDFDSWLSHFIQMGKDETNNYYKCYHPANYQSKALTSKFQFVHDGRGGFDPNMTLAKSTYKDLDFVALVEFFHESQCMLYYRLGDKAPPEAISYLSKSCKCEEQQDDRQKNAVKNIHIRHHNKAKRFNLRDLPAATLSKVAHLTAADSSIYMLALKNFMDELAWLESAAGLGRRVVCDDALQKWEQELAYLDDGRFNVTELYRNAVTRQQ